MRALVACGIVACAGLVHALPEDAAYRAATPGRRERLLAGLPEGSVVVLRAASESDAEVSDRFRQDSDFWYLTAFPEPGAVAVLKRVDGHVRYSLFVRAKDFVQEQWTGFRVGPEAARQEYGADEALPFEELWKRLPEMLRGAGALYFSHADDAFREQLRAEWQKGDANTTAPRPLADVGPAIRTQRLVKDEVELRLMRRAASLSADAHIAALARVRPGVGEAELKAAMVSTCLSGGAARMGYAPIVGSGRNAVILHYDEASRIAEAGAMIVNDSACEYGMYSADVTRSYPVSARFTREQRAVYELVLEAQKAGLAQVKPGAPYHRMYDATVEVIVDGLLRLGLLQGQRDELIQSRAYKAFYPHGCCHWIGLNVHDPSSYAYSDPTDRYTRYATAQTLLQPGMVVTVEPGIYIPEGSTPDKRWWNVAARIEDTVLVAPNGPECLSCAAPRELADVLKAMSAAHLAR
jgi:Xaa-Pro aminopeptidase